MTSISHQSYPTTMSNDNDHDNDNDNNTVLIGKEDSSMIEIIEVNYEQYEKIKKLQKLQKSGVPLDAIQARCKIENINYDWIITSSSLQNGSNTKKTIQFVLQGTNNTNGNNNTNQFKYFKVNEDDASSVDFFDNKAPITALVRLSVPTIQRRGQLDIKSGTGTYSNVQLIDLQNSTGYYRAVQYDRTMFLSTIDMDGNNKNDYTDDEIHVKRRRFLQHLSSIGVRPPTIVSTTTHQSIIDLIPGLDELVQFLSPQTSLLYQNIIQNNTYTFDDLSNIYIPGMLCIAKNVVVTGVDCIVQVIMSKYEQGKTLGGIVRRFVVSFQFICTVQNYFTIAEFTEHIVNFDNTRRIDTLPYIPLYVVDPKHSTTNGYCSTLSLDNESVLKDTRSRGQLFEKVSIDDHFVQYQKGSFFPLSTGFRSIGAASTTGSTNSSSSASRSDGRIMIDTVGSYEAGYSVSTGYDTMIFAIHEKVKEINVHIRQQLNKKKSSISSLTNGNSTTDSINLDGPLMMKTIPSCLIELTWPTVCGFSFTSKCWGDVLIEGVSEIQFAETSFDQLVLPPSTKRMIKALVRHSNDNNFHDIISGKGEGSVFLLYGPPGVGKTLTAEAISELLHRPLYTVSLGQLGTTPVELETKMSNILDLCSRWDALILLDEADIFLEKRSSSNSGGSSASLERNAMVSIMLRLVEYFKGVLFLTSNRVDTLDPAFRTRITLALQYEQLDVTAREQVWYNLLVASGQDELLMNNTINTIELATVATLNGREIKNCIRLALALAAEDQCNLTQSILLETITLVNNFNKKLDEAQPY
jgi:AAA+ superfamily predicted ATPase